MKIKSLKDIITLFKHNNAKRFGLFFALAFLFLVISKLSSDYKYNLILKIQLENLEEEIVVKTDTSNTLKAVVDAKGFSLMPYINNNTKTLVLDAKTDVKQYNSNFYFNTINKRYLIESQLGSSLKLIDIKPDSLKIAFSKQFSKKVPVELNADINYAIGYNAKNDIVLDSVKLVGTKEALNKISRVSTKYINLNNVSSDINIQVSLDDSKLQKNFIKYPQQLPLKINVERFTEGVFKLPVKIINQPKNVQLNFFPKEITLKYYTDLQNFKSISTEDFEVVCDFNNMHPNKSYIIPKISKQPEGIKRVTLKQKSISIIKL